jgi:hypothetical protein
MVKKVGLTSQQGKGAWGVQRLFFLPSFSRIYPSRSRILLETVSLHTSQVRARNLY